MSAGPATVTTRCPTRHLRFREGLERGARLAAFVISSTSTAFRALEKRYGNKLPQVRGDWTPYWEDGAASSAAETAMNRASSERLAQAETLWAMLDPRRIRRRNSRQRGTTCCFTPSIPGARFAASRNRPIRFTSDQWTIKQSYAAAANLQSRQLLSAAAQDGLGFRP